MRNGGIISRTLKSLRTSGNAIPLAQLTWRRPAQVPTRVTPDGRRLPRRSSAAGGSAASGTTTGSSTNGSTTGSTAGSTTTGPATGPTYTQSPSGNTLGPNASPSGSTLTPTGPGSGMGR